MSIPLSGSTVCQVCLQVLPNPHSVWDRTCKACIANQVDYKSSVEAAMPERHPVKLPYVQRLDENGRVGVKHDTSKAQWGLLPWEAISNLVGVLTFGAQKYSPNGWRSVPGGRERYLAALLRHLAAHQLGEKTDPESGLRHIDHALACLVFLSELED